MIKVILMVLILACGMMPLPLLLLAAITWLAVRGLKRVCSSSATS
jgi:hypothetical protein